MQLLREAQRVFATTDNEAVKRTMEKVINYLTSNTESVVFNGEYFPAVCSCGCNERLGDKAIVILGASLIFINEEHLLNFISMRTADIELREASHAS